MFIEHVRIENEEKLGAALQATAQRAREDLDAVRRDIRDIHATLRAALPSFQRQEAEKQEEAA